jgi:uncharacterized protein YcaQ
MSKPLTLTKEEAGAFLVTVNGLHRRTHKSNTTTKRKEAIMETFDSLGCIQFDPLNVVGRNPDLVLQSRIGGYKHQDLYDLLYKDRLLMDGWDKVMSIYPTADWPYFHRIRQRRAIGSYHELEYRNSLEALDLLDEVYDHITNNGPTKPKDLSGETVHKGTWGQSKLTSAALDHLYFSGKIRVHSKQGSNKSYDLTHRLIPEPILNTPDPFKNDHSFLDWYLLRRIHGAGLIWSKNGGHWYGYYIQKKTQRLPIIQRLLDSGQIVAIHIQQVNEPFYMSLPRYEELSEFLTQYRRLLNQKKQVRFLAPLDNFLWDRDLIELLFGFNYRWEVYTPLAKRQFGYYVLPILYGFKLVGRIEFDYYRGDALNILNTWYEPWFKPSQTFEKAFQNELKCFSEYLSTL